MAELKAQLADDAVAAGVSEFRTILSSAIARREDIFERDGDGRLRLLTQDIEFVD